MARNQSLLFGFYLDALRMEEVVDRCRTADSRYFRTRHRSAEEA